MYQRVSKEPIPYIKARKDETLSRKTHISFTSRLGCQRLLTWLCFYRGFREDPVKLAWFRKLRSNRQISADHRKKKSGIKPPYLAQIV